jgi:hypothetical protein
MIKKRLIFGSKLNTTEDNIKNKLNLFIFFYFFQSSSTEECVATTIDELDVINFLLDGGGPSSSASSITSSISKYSISLDVDSISLMFPGFCVNCFVVGIAFRSCEKIGIYSLSNY